MLTADLSFREFPALLKGVVEYEKKLQVEGNGVKYRIGDFHVAFVTISTGQSPAIKGLLLEVSGLLTCKSRRLIQRSTYSHSSHSHRLVFCQFVSRVTVASCSLLSADSIFQSYLWGLQIRIFLHLLWRKLSWTMWRRTSCQNRRMRNC